MEHGENIGCSVTTIPLHMCIAISVHKAQGMATAQYHFCRRIVVNPLYPKYNKMVGMELICISFAVETCSVFQLVIVQIN